MDSSLYIYFQPAKGPSCQSGQPRGEGGKVLQEWPGSSTTLLIILLNLLRTCTDQSKISDQMTLCVQLCSAPDIFKFDFSFHQIELAKYCDTHFVHCAFSSC